MTIYKVPNALLLSLAVATGMGRAAETFVPPSGFALSDPDLEVTVWATSPMIKNPTNIDFDKDGRIWVAEGVDYRRHYDRQKEGDRIMVLEDTDGDGRADQSRVFVQEEFLRAPMGIAVIDNKVIVSMTPDMIVYTDVNRDQKFDPAVDKREVILTGFNGRVHDHSLHSVTVGPDGQWYWNAGNCGAVFTDKSGKTFRVGGAYDPYYGRKASGDLGWNPIEIAGQKSDDGHVYVGGFAARMNPDGSGVHIIGYNFRNSYEQTVTSFGDVFQNDNDDPPACRTTFLMEYGNAGFFSFDGSRLWQADRRPGQSIPVAEWRQEDPGTIPAGDVYGGGSPTGIFFVEESALGKKYRGMLLSAEPGRNVIFGYFPKPEGAGFKLERFDFLTSNKEGEFAGGDFKGGDRSVTGELKTCFRPSDVSVGPDGAIYVADFFDPRVGGHNDMDATLSGTIYRVAPRGFRPKVPHVDLTTLKGQIAALKNPSVNVRGAAFYALQSQGAKAIKPVAALLKDENPYVRARAVWLLSQLGSEGIARIEPLLKDRDSQMRVVAFRALRRENQDLLGHARSLATDVSPAVRREVALALRDVSFNESKDILLALARGYDGQDRTYLEALGTGASGKESELYDYLLQAFTRGTRKDGAVLGPILWPAAFAKIAWRLHPPQSVAAFKTRAILPALPAAERKAAMVAIGYNATEEAAQAMLEIAGQTEKGLKADAIWWLLNRKDNQWKPYGLNSALKERHIYDPDNIELIEATVPEPQPTKLPPIKDILALKGNVQRGGDVFSSVCATCHRLGDNGTDYAPNLTGWAQRQTTEVLLQSVINPSADIAHGFEGYQIKTKDGVEIDGLVLSSGDPLIVQSAAGLTQTIPANRVKSRRPFERSLMLSADQLGLTAQNLADVAAFLKTK